MLFTFFINNDELRYHLSYIVYNTMSFRLSLAWYSDERHCQSLVMMTDERANKSMTCDSFLCVVYYRYCDICYHTSSSWAYYLSCFVIWRSLVIYIKRSTSSYGLARYRTMSSSDSNSRSGLISCNDKISLDFYSLSIDFCSLIIINNTVLLFHNIKILWIIIKIHDPQTKNW